LIRKSPKRIFALLWAILLLLNTAGEGFGISGCPYHDGFPSPESGGEHRSGHHGAPAEHGNHQGDSTAEHAPGEDSSSRLHEEQQSHPGHHPEGEACTHLDACQTPSTAAVPTAAFAISTWSFAMAAPTRVGAPDSTVPRHPAYFLPFAQAPPDLG